MVRQLRPMRSAQPGTKSGRVPKLSAIVMERRPALSELVVDRIRDAIISGELSLGETISEERLSTMLGVSRTPVREALTHLQLQGLVDIKPQRGSFVFSPTQEDIAELCEFRAMVEIGAMQLSWQKNQARTLDALNRAQAKLVAAEAADDWGAASRADAEFHSALIENSGNRVLVQAYALISGRIDAARFFTRRSDSSRRNTAQEHDTIIDAFARGKMDVATSCLTLHITSMPKRFIEAQMEIAS